MAVTTPAVQVAVGPAPLLPSHRRVAHHAAGRWPAAPRHASPLLGGHRPQSPALLRWESVTARSLPPFPTKGPLGGAIIGGTFLGPIGGILGYLGMLGVDHVTGGKEEEEEVPDLGITPELMQMAKDLRNELEGGEETFRICGLAAAKARARLADLGASVKESHYEAGLAVQAGDEERELQLLALKEERLQELREAQRGLLEAEASLEGSRLALEELTERAIELDSRMQRNIAITRTRMAESPMYKPQEQ
mmetsp:Transcript_8534/g.24489  ORF Transcript_8534/g.24489 Transcript_8534/m.24489 type:complete len:250 (-) Transcript_8534:67-816(-)